MHTSSYIRRSSSSSTLNLTQSQFQTTTFPHYTTNTHNVHPTTKVDFESAEHLAKRLFQHYAASSPKLTPNEAQNIISDAQSFTNPSSAQLPQPDKLAAENFVKHHDRDLDGQLTKKDFIECCIQYLCGPGGSGVNLFGKMTAREELINYLHGELGMDEVDKELAQARFVFEKYDGNKDGFLDRNEVRVMMRDTYANLKDNISLTDDAVDKYFQMIDTELDDLISRDEYEIFVLEALKSRNIQ